MPEITEVADVGGGDVPLAGTLPWRPPTAWPSSARRCGSAATRSGASRP